MEIFLFSVVEHNVQIFTRSKFCFGSYNKKRSQAREKLDQLDQIAGLHPRVAQSAGLGEGFRVCISNDFPTAADATGPGIVF